MKNEFIKTVKNIVSNAVMELHTAFFAVVLSVNKDGTEATVQPLALTKEYGSDEEKQSVLDKIPVLESARKFSKEKVTVNCGGYTDNITIPKVTGVEVGDIVYCLCADRNITETKKGEFALPAKGHHSLSDAVVIGIWTG
ncbi:MAG: hypothetical protein ACI4CT_05370 [Lachnospiraceae bacterium]